MSSETSSTKWGQFLPLVSVFFFWGFVAASNDILIPVFIKAFNLSHFQGQLVAFAFYVAYFVGALLYILVSLIMKGDPINKIGYKNGLALGLTISALGTLLFYPAANTGSFTLMLSGLFIVALGFSLQQTVANPLAIALGTRSTASQRLTLAGGINNLGTTIGPLIVTFAIFGGLGGKNEASIESVKIPYLVLGAAFLLVAVLLKFSSLPDKPASEEEEVKVEGAISKKHAIYYPQLALGMIAIFVYVGVEVATASNLPSYMETIGFSTQAVTPFVSLYWASLMIGRWTGAVEAFGLKESTQKIVKLIAPYLAFGVFLFASKLFGYELADFYVYAIVILVLIAADIASKGNPARMLLIFSLLGITALLVGIFTEGLVSSFAFISVGLFCSTLWPCIFTVAVSGLGDKTAQGSNLLIMMILGGALIPPLQGLIADKIDIKISYFVGVICFAYLAFYAWKVAKILTKQGINFDKKIGGGH
ncbi:MAG: MFS transporter [Bacteroidetes bacterium]|nr:MFS transporter [Bacteroidota bacterium]